ncbi:UNKNOWN [Stylonychia lemnae]|uniref:Ef hand family protein n=1 Tax=Stylonychia lemnae TaxID=5949 RepID=A0A078ATL1_STYLE|nr:UNKNOWN [Stylonychia lemnae]|eukprot:CDW84542.1 UNKNOWN [Stylonychia lemnae]
MHRQLAASKRQSISHPIKIDTTFTQEIISGHTQSLVCEYFLLLIENQEQKLVLKDDIQLVEGFNPINIFQRIDRSQCGFITHADILQFLRDNNIVSLDKDDIKLLFKKDKTIYQVFLRTVLSQVEHESAKFFNVRASESEIVVRKIDKLPKRLERKFSQFILQLVQLEKQIEIMKQVTVQKQKDFDFMRMFKIIRFHEHDANVIVPQDIKRMFVMNNQTIDEIRVQNVLFGQILGRNVMSFQDFCNLFVKQGHKIVITGATQDQSNSLKAQVSHLAQKSIMQEFTEKKQKSIFQVSTKDVMKADGNKTLNTLRSSNSIQQQLETQTELAKTLTFKTDYISSEKIVKNFITYVQEQIILDDQLEDLRIKLTNDRDFYPQQVYKTYLNQDSSLNDIEPNELLEFVQDPSINIDEVIQALDFHQISGSKLNLDTFRLLIRPSNKDFALLYDKRCQEEIENEAAILDKTRYKSDTKEKLMSFFRGLVINTMKNIEIRKTYSQQSKGKGVDIFRFITQNMHRDAPHSMLVEFLKNRGVTLNRKESLYLRERFCQDHYLSSHKFEQQFRY